MNNDLKNQKLYFFETNAASMKKVILLSCYFKHNYGSMLQAYATQRFLDINQIDNETIDVSNLNDFKKNKKKFYFRNILNFRFIKAKSGMIKLLIRKRFSRKLKKNLCKRDFQFKRFEKRYFTLSNPYKTFSQLKDYCFSTATDVVVGSDQLWLPVNVFGDYYTASFVPDSINKLSYATSFGVKLIPKKYHKRYSDFLSRFNHISVRESQGKDIVKGITHRDCDVVCDPTLLLDEKEWNNLISNKRIINDKYILCYYLGKSKNHRKFAEKLRELTGYKIVSINHCDEYVRYSDKFADFTPYDVGPSEWLNLIKNAEVVCTDSFHGTVFSTIFRKKFFVFPRYNKKNAFSTNSRIDSFLNISNLKERFFTGSESIDKIQFNLKQEIDYTKTWEELQSFISKSQKFFLENLTFRKANTKAINISSKQLCMGCTACANICSKNAISMMNDSEGFKYPVVNKALCINCGLCKSVCPSINLKKEIERNQKGYLIQNLDEKILKESTSGGAFTSIASYIIKNGGVVFGACFDENNVVHHKFVDNNDDLFCFRNSKYVQSDLGETFKSVEKFLSNGCTVLFSGTPCQIEGLKSFLFYKNISTSRLYLVDIVCHSVPSPMVWEKYKTFRNKKHLFPDSFRNKEKYGYEYSQMCLKNEKGKKKYFGSESDPYFRAFLNDLSIRPSCEGCKFKKRYRESDLTLWDCFCINKFDKTFDNNKGVTRCLTHSDKGEFLIENIKKNCNVRELPADDCVLYSRELFVSVNKNPNREEFLKDANILDCEELFKKWCPDKLSIKIKRAVRKTLEKIGIYRVAKRFVKKLLGRQ